MLRPRYHLHMDDLPDGALDAALEAAWCAVDLETSGLDWRNGEIGSCQVWIDPGVAHIVKVRSAIPSNLVQLMEATEISKIFHHAMFDLRWMIHHWHVAPVVIRCTKVASKLLCPDAEPRAHSLKILLSERLRVEIDKREQTSNWLASDYSDTQLEYAASDVAYLYALLDNLQEELRRSDLLDVFDSCMTFLPVRARLEVGGWPDVFTY